MNVNNFSTRKNKNNKLLLIQSLRGIAALLVLAHHLTVRSNELLNQNFLAGIFHFGSSGVDFFFVLSGFIIFYVHRYDIGNKKKLKTFLIKRFVRVYPIYFLITLIVFPVYLFGYGDSYKTNISVILKSFLLLPQDNGIYPILNVGWTLSYEAFFYLLFSLAIRLKPQITKIIFTVWMSIIIAMFILEISGVFRPNNTLINFIFSSQNLEFIFGCLIAYLVQTKKLGHKNYILAGGIVIFIFSAIINDIYKIIYIHPVIAYGIPSAFIVLGAALRDISQPAKIPGIFIYLGDASYSIYLTHFVIITALMLLVIKLGLIGIIGYPLTITIISIVTLVCGCLVFSYVEKPLLVFMNNKIVHRLQPVRQGEYVSKKNSI